MPRIVRQRRPLPARVYWTRRLVVVGIPLALVVVLARMLGGPSPEAPSRQARPAAASVAPTPAPTAGPTAEAVAGTSGAKGRKDKRDQEPVPPPEPVLAEPTGPCVASDIVATPLLTSVAGGGDIPITLNLRTLTTEACTWQASAETMTVTITSGSDYIWSSRECPASIPPQDVVVRSTVDTPVVVTWSGKRSDEGCNTQWTEWAKVGFYHVEAAALGGDGTDVQFELVPRPSEVITKSAEPSTPAEPTGDADDTSHTPGEDGAGNSAG